MRLRVHLLLLPPGRSPADRRAATRMPPASAGLRLVRAKAASRTRATYVRRSRADRRQSQQVSHRDRIPGRLGTVVIFLHAKNQGGIVRGRTEEPAVTGVFEQL